MQRNAWEPGREILRFIRPLNLRDATCEMWNKVMYMENCCFTYSARPMPLDSTNMNWCNTLKATGFCHSTRRHRPVTQDVCLSGFFTDCQRLIEIPAWLVW